MSTVYSDVGFRKINEIPNGLCDELKSMSRDLSFHQSALTIFYIREGRPNHWVRPQEIANAWCRNQAELHTWVFDFHRPTGVLKHYDSVTVIYFRSTLIQFPALSLMPVALMQWPEFVTRLLPFLASSPFPSHPKLDYACVVGGAEHQSYRSLLTNNVLSFLENRLEVPPRRSRALPPGIQTGGNQMVFYRTGTNIPQEGFVAFLNEAEELLRLLTMAVWDHGGSPVPRER